MSTNDEHNTTAQTLDVAPTTIGYLLGVIDRTSSALIDQPSDGGSNARTDRK